MKKIAWLMMVLLLLGTLCGCKGKEKLQFFVVDAEQINGSETDWEMLRLAKREGRLVFTEEDLEGYLWEEHIVRLRAEPVRGSDSDGGSRLFQAKAADQFLVVIGNKVIYRGGFAPASGDANVPMSPYIKDLDHQSFAIVFDEKYSEEKDPRSGSVLYDHLVDRQLLSSKLNETNKE